mmetsp:Transcript_49457/g.165129  ORF Transcript_49457/g.165129 Transcript_49457/m.165129 type:complete len:201 (+) Transcript_49457:293-895(+)
MAGASGSAGAGGMSSLPSSSLGTRSSGRCTARGWPSLGWGRRARRTACSAPRSSPTPSCSLARTAAATCCSCWAARPSGGSYRSLTRGWRRLRRRWPPSSPRRRAASRAPSSQRVLAPSSCWTSGRSKTNYSRRARSATSPHRRRASSSPPTARPPTPSTSSRRTSPETCQSFRRTHRAPRRASSGAAVTRYLCGGAAGW